MYSNLYVSELIFVLECSGFVQAAGSSYSGMKKPKWFSATFIFLQTVLGPYEQTCVRSCESHVTSFVVDTGGRRSIFREWAIFL